jgi:hypothetical protein
VTRDVGVAGSNAAFDSGDRSQLESYYKAYQPDSLRDVDFDLMVFEGTGGFDLLSIRRSAPAAQALDVAEKLAATVLAKKRSNRDTSDR